MNKETGEKTTQYYYSVLEAKIVLGDNLIVSIASEFIENDGEDADRQKKMSAEEIKQDCESKAFKKLAENLKNHYLITQIADIILQLYEKTIHIIKELKKTIKNISSDLLASFARQLTKEDISYTQKRTVATFFYPNCIGNTVELQFLIESSVLITVT